jgi:DNA-binding response OmpR family regulator
VLDRLVGGMDASTFIPKIRRRWPATKILVLSAIGTSAEKSRVLDIGADEYVSKPFSIEELGARIRAVMRRAEQDSGLYCRLGNIVLLLPSHSTQIDGVSVDLSRKEYQLLRTFMGTPTRVFSKFQLLDLVWGVNSEVESNVVEGTLLNLRKKLARAGARPRIMNRRLVGYWIEE